MSTSFLPFSQLVHVGHTSRSIQALVAQGHIRKVRPGIYAPAGVLEPLEQHREVMMATVPLVDPSNVFSHTSAAVVHGLPVRSSDLQQLTMTRLTAGHGHQTPALRVRRTRLDQDEIIEMEGFRVTTLARTTSDQIRLLPFTWGLVTADAALRKGLAPHELAASLQRHPRLHGVTKARRVASLADARSESAAESLSRAQMHLAGLPAPEVQFEIFNSDGAFVARCDFGWPAYGLVGEVDGKSKYGDLLRPGRTAADAVMAEKIREERIRQEGFWVVRWDWGVASDLRALTARIRAGLENAVVSAT